VAQGEVIDPPGWRGGPGGHGRAGASSRDSLKNGTALRSVCFWGSPETLADPRATPAADDVSVCTQSAHLGPHRVKAARAAPPPTDFAERVGERNWARRSGGRGSSRTFLPRGVRVRHAGMNTNKALLGTAAFFTLVTCAGHTMGTFMPVPPEQADVVAGLEVMQRTMVPMPVGAARSFATLLDGNSIGLSIWMLVSGLMFIAAARAARPDKVSLALNSAGMGALALLSAFYFFPVPAACLAVAAVAGGVAAVRG